MVVGKIWDFFISLLQTHIFLWHLTTKAAHTDRNVLGLIPGSAGAAAQPGIAALHHWCVCTKPRVLPVRHQINYIPEQLPLSSKASMVERPPLIGGLVMTGVGKVLLPEQNPPTTVSPLQGAFSRTPL